MYWYISFLRPPPVATEAGSSISITPQVANDLRTELKYEPTEIHYYWQIFSPYIGTPLAPSYLTTFEPPGNTYRPVEIALPSEARPGESWRLCLFSPCSTGSEGSSRAASFGAYDILDLSGLRGSFGPISVHSEGIEIRRPADIASAGPTRGVGTNGKDKGKSKGREKGSGLYRDEMPPGGAGKGKGKGKAREDGPKQTRIRREWLCSGGPISVVEQTSFDLDKKIWDSGLALSSWLFRHCADGSPRSVEFVEAKSRPDPDITKQRVWATVRTLGSAAGPCNVLELGSGTGLVSLALRALLKSQHRATDASIVATDLDSAIPLMEENIAINDIRSLDTRHTGRGAGEDSEEEEQAGEVQVEAKVLDWDQPLPKWLTDTDTWPELVIAADVTYNTASFPSLVRTLPAILHPPGRDERPLLLLAYKQRDEAERALWTMLAEESISLSRIDTVQGAEEGGEVEIWVGQSTLK